MSRDGNAYSGDVGMYITVESEFETVREAEKRHPDLKVAKVTVKKLWCSTIYFQKFCYFFKVLFLFLKSKYGTELGGD